ncbi:NADP-dependent malic enzyme-like isoform X2 [Agrilus planipennis]|uniref:NADP-dependent malic enzyme-like isoform X2 n=1 Tax=Agrilus planipennis TaxID=224129 RepID=A0A1W4WUV5_AGRPL|nr:NADP-dependent malic enzyme-like isoform X2 [Agrilus planipennis]
MLPAVSRSLLSNGPTSRIVLTSCRHGIIGVAPCNNSTSFENGLQRCKFHSVGGKIISPSQVKGIDHLRDPRLNKGLAFTLEERQLLGIHGLQPPRFKTQEEQIEICQESVRRYNDDLNKYLYLAELQDRNEKLFFGLLMENVEELMPIVYTPTVGLACQKFGLIYRRPRGLFITINDRGHILDVLKNWPEESVRCVCVTDGQRILGLGDLGAQGMGIPVGKLALYTALAGIPPYQCLPVLLDVGTNNENLLEDPLYVGLRHKRVTGVDYDEFVDEFMEAVVRRYGQNTLIQFEDFASPNAFKFLNKYRNQYCTFNDDIQGTASVVLAGVQAAQRVTGKTLPQNKFVFFGAGAAALGIASLIAQAMVMEGLSLQQARDQIWMMDIDGLVTKDRDPKSLLGGLGHFAKDKPPLRTLIDVVNEVKPQVLIGASTAAGTFTPEVLNSMAKTNERPIIFALSNPTSKAECTAEQAFIHTQGRCLFSSGSPFPPVEYEGKIYKTGQGNNAYIFPGVALGILATGMYHIKEEVFLIAAKAVAETLTPAELESGTLYPPLKQIQNVSMHIAVKLCEYAYEKGLASVYPEPQDKMAWVKTKIFSYKYEPSLPDTYQWPEADTVKPKREIKPVTVHGVVT